VNVIIVDTSLKLIVSSSCYGEHAASLCISSTVFKLEEPTAI